MIKPRSAVCKINTPPVIAPAPPHILNFCFSVHAVEEGAEKPWKVLDAISPLLTGLSVLGDGQVDFEEFVTLLGPKLSTSGIPEKFHGTDFDTVFWKVCPGRLAHGLHAVESCAGLTFWPSGLPRVSGSQRVASPGWNSRSQDQRLLACIAGLPWLQCGALGGVSSHSIVLLPPSVTCRS